MLGWCVSLSWQSEPGTPSSPLQSTPVSHSQARSANGWSSILARLGGVGHGRRPSLYEVCLRRWFRGVPGSLLRKLPGAKQLTCRSRAPEGRLTSSRPRLLRSDAFLACGIAMRVRGILAAVTPLLSSQQLGKSFLCCSAGRHSTGCRPCLAKPCSPPYSFFLVSQTRLSKWTRYTAVKRAELVRSNDLPFSSEQKRGRSTRRQNLLL